MTASAFVRATFRHSAAWLVPSSSSITSDRRCSGPERQNVRPHPHIGLSTLTYLLEGEMVSPRQRGQRRSDPTRRRELDDGGQGHRSLGAYRPRRSRPTAGRCSASRSGSPCPRPREEMQPGFSHHAEGTLPGLEADGVCSPSSRAKRLDSARRCRSIPDLMYVDVVLKPGARLQVPAEHIERALFVVSGEIEIAGQTGTFGEAQLVVFRPGAEIVAASPPWRRPPDAGRRRALFRAAPHPLELRAQARRTGSSRPKTTGGLADSRDRRRDGVHPAAARPARIIIDDAGTTASSNSKK